MSGLAIFDLPPDPAEAGFVHGRAIVGLLADVPRERYIERVRTAVGFDAAGLADHAADWLSRLEPHVQVEIAAMADGAGIRTIDTARFLFADIASPTAAPLCSSLLTTLPEQSPWIARNCDWLTPTLERGTAAVAHRTPHRIPILALGIRGDIDLDTGINAEGLWLHLHTMYAADPIPEDARVMSWLFWAREALETCASIDALESFIRSTTRDRGVIAIAAESTTGACTVFECKRASYARHDVEGPLCVTNHSLSKEYPPRAASSGNEAGTIARQQSMRSAIEAEPPRNGPDDLIRVLAGDGVEMRTPRWIRTIYSVVIDVSRPQIWFSAGSSNGLPAASRGSWTEVIPPWA